MSRIYSDSLFHYTNNEDALVGILEKGFQVKCSKEQFIDSTGGFAYLDIPMVSFCDVPLNFIQYITYGGFAIGLSRAWANEKELAPVYYYLNSRKAVSNQLMRKMYMDYVGNKSIDSQKFLAYIKPMRKYRDGSYGVKTLPDGTKIILRKDNYIEREWRKVYLTKWNNEVFYDKCPKYVPFKCKNVTFIIVPDSKGRNSIISRLKSMATISGRPISNTGNDVESLISKVLTISEIKKNF